MARPRKETFTDLGRELRLHVLTLAIAISILWAEEIVDVMLGEPLNALGIRPREVRGLIGIPLAPFLHGGFAHLAANTGPFLVLGFFVLLRERWHFYFVSAVTILLGGLAVWAFGQSGSVHIGASGLIFGWLGYALFGGFFERRIGTIVGSILVAVLYGSLVFGVMPGVPGVSWESHLFGFLAGVSCAWALARRDKKTGKR